MKCAAQLDHTYLAEPEKIKNRHTDYVDCRPNPRYTPHTCPANYMLAPCSAASLFFLLGAKFFLGRRLFGCLCRRVLRSAHFWLRDRFHWCGFHGWGCHGC